MSNSDCEHPISEENRCLKCGEESVTARWRLEDIDEENADKFWSDVASLGGLGDIRAICEIAAEANDEYKDQIKENSDPKNPSLPKLSMVGTSLVRIPFKKLWKDVISVSYFLAKEKGYLGDLEMWEEFVADQQKVNS